jgi:hypothetical protein
VDHPHPLADAVGAKNDRSSKGGKQWTFSDLINFQFLEGNSTAHQNPGCALPAK